MASQIKNGLREGLDDFLSLGEKEDRHARSNNFNFDDEVEASRPLNQAPRREAPMAATPKRETSAPQMSSQQSVNSQGSRMIGEEMFEKQKTKIDDLEKKLFELTRSFERFHKKEPIGIYQLRTTLRSLDINEIYIQQLIKKGLFELTDSDVENADIVFEFALREMMTTVSTAMPLFFRRRFSEITSYNSICFRSFMWTKLNGTKNWSNEKRCHVIIRNGNYCK